MNTVNLIGNLTRKPEVRYTTSQEPMAICRFTVAVNEGYGEDKKASFIPVTVFGKQAENCEKYLDKGSKVGITGRLKSGSYEKEGRTVYTMDVIADGFNGVEFISTKPRDNAPEGFTALTEDESIPF